MSEISAALIAKALDGLSLRYQYTAQNIANANSSTYTPRRVTFEEDLKAAALKGLAAIDRVRPDVQQAPDMELTTAATRDMRLDMELATASQTAMRYRALLNVLGRQMSLNEAVLSGGR